MSQRLRWVSWAAVSSLPQAKKISLDDQLQINRDHAAKHNGEIVAELVIPGESRSIILFEDAARKIEAYAELRRLLDAKAFDVLAYLDPSRLGRIDALVLAVRALCRAAGVICYETDNPPVNLELTRTYDDDLLSAIKAVGAEREVRKMTARHASGMLGRAKAGDHPNHMPYGYRTTWQHDGQQLRQVYEVDESEAATVRQIFSMYLSGKGCEAISIAMGDPTWNKHAVRNIVRNVRQYAGYVEINRRTKSNRPYYIGRANWPAIIDETTMQRVLAERAARADNRKVANARHVLSGVCRCALCGRPLVVRRPTNTTRVYLICPWHAPQLFVRDDVLLAAVRQFIAFVGTQDIDALLADDGDTSAQVQAQIAAQHRELARIDKARERANTAYVDGNMDAADYSAQVARLKAQRMQVEAEIARLEAAAADESLRSTRRERAAELAADGIAMLDSGDTPAVNAWLRERITVVVGRDTVDIQFR